jgi:siroheme synthase, N-terminal domain
MGLYPLFADLRGREVLVVGGGEVAARKVAALLEAGAVVRLHATAVRHPELAAALEAGRIERLAGDFDPAWLDAAWLVVAATDDAAFNAALAVEAGRRRRLVNVVDDAALSSFHVPAVVDRSPLVVAISSGGAAPMLARQVRQRLETLLDPALGALAALLARHRARIRQALPDTTRRRRWFDALLGGRLAGLAADPARLEAAFEAELQRAAAAVRDEGSVTLVQAGAPDLYTLRALRALNAADVLLLVGAVDEAALEPARRDARRVHAGVDAAPGRAVALAREGLHVACVHAAGCAVGESVARACAEAGVPCQRVPAVSTTAP